MATDDVIHKRLQAARARTMARIETATVLRTRVEIWKSSAVWHSAHVRLSHMSDGTVSIQMEPVQDDDLGQVPPQSVSTV